VREVSTPPSDSRSWWQPSWADRLSTRRMYTNVVPKVQACHQVSCASVAPLMPWEKPG
jgi:hypothetical protein